MHSVLERCIIERWHMLKMVLKHTTKFFFLACLVLILNKITWIVFIYSQSCRNNPATVAVVNGTGPCCSDGVKVGSNNRNT